jgi:hypothetical protein
MMRQNGADQIEILIEKANWNYDLYAEVAK